METFTENSFFRAIVTAYSSSPDETEGDPLITASGATVRKGIVACSRDYPFGTRFLIDGEVYECLDRLAPHYDDRIDIWMPSKEEALEHGKKELLIKVVAVEESKSEG
ncbi:MAG: 3D domain-containing protein [Acidobacteria bacterium]|nr:3D domain-containing protein [Acidobacteriota bacterium]